MNEKLFLKEGDINRTISVCQNKKKFSLLEFFWHVKKKYVTVQSIT